MGYITVFLVFEKPHFIGQLVEPLFASDFFSPSSLSGLNNSDRGRDWLLGGISLEWFLRKNLVSQSDRLINRVEIAAKPDSTNLEYLQALSNRIQNNQSLNWQLSPYEVADHNLQITSLSGQPLEKSVLKHLDEWKGARGEKLNGLDGSMIRLYSP